MIETDVFESTEIPEFEEDVVGEEAEDEDIMGSIPAGDVQFAVRCLFVRLAESCLSHAHAKEQAPPESDSSTTTTSAAMTDSVAGGEQTSEEPLFLKKKSFPRILAAIKNAKEMLDSLETDKQFVVDVLLQCVEGIAVKSSLYGSLVFLLKEDTELMTKLIETIKTEMNNCIGSGRFRQLKLLCRFVVELIKSNCIKSSALMIILNALDSLRACDNICEDITYVICMTILWAFNIGKSRSLEEFSTKFLKDIDEKDSGKQHCVAVANALQTIRGLCQSNSWRKTGLNSSYFVLHPSTALKKGSERSTTDFGSLDLHPPEGGATLGFEHSCRSFVVPKQLCGTGSVVTAFTAFDCTVYTDSLNDTICEFLDNGSLCVKYLTSFIPVEAHYLQAYNAHLINTLFSMMISEETPFTAPDMRLLYDVISKLLHTPSSFYQPLIIEARTFCLKNLETMNPRGIVRLANWIAMELDLTQYKDWNWEETIVPLVNVEDHNLNAQKLFVDSLLARCCALDSKLSFCSKPDFPTVVKEIAKNIGSELLNKWPDHISNESSSQKLLSRLVTVCPAGDMNTLVKDVEKESGVEHEVFMRRFADCIVKVCSMSYLHCVGVLNQQYENISEINSKTLSESLWRCCGNNTPVFNLILDKMTTAGLISFADAVEIIFTDDGVDDEMKTDDSVRKVRCVPWEALDLAIEKCAMVESSNRLDVIKHAVSSAAEYAKRAESQNPFYASLAASYSIHWQHFLG